jgi:hypothetical protein
VVYFLRLRAIALTLRALALRGVPLQLRS